MELALSLGDTPKPFMLLDQQQHKNMKDLGFCMGFKSNKNKLEDVHDDKVRISCSSSSDPSSSSPPLQLDLLPFSPVLKSPPPPPPPPASTHRTFPWLSKNFESGSQITKPTKVIDAKPLTIASDHETGEEQQVAGDSSPNNSTNSGTSSFQINFTSIFNGGRSFNSRKRDSVNLELVDVIERDHRACSRGGGGLSDEDENGLTRKKLRLTKEQSAFLEDSFKEHNSLNPKQKQALAKQLNLRPRQVEVWFQNRRARTKLKQTEVDCEYLKRCCETLTEENRRLQKELQELRALKTSQPFYMQMPATTLTMCPSCERVATTTTTTATTSPGQQSPPTGSHGH
ncbi:homeobox-leucine zipper protein HAT14-like isoform X2 [Bidens hawaiensis]|uniref:homeobox-leucine zipper protein HAT14-like isoform X2 n=1 Tax=Bidens hawaiensis TaxID=980011 RepID=UPI004049A6C5